MKRETARGEGEEQERRSKVLTTRVEWEFAERLEEKAEKRGVSVSSYLRQLVIADIENVKDKVILAALEKIEQRTRKLHEDAHEFMMKY